MYYINPLKTAGVLLTVHGNKMSVRPICWHVDQVAVVKVTVLTVSRQSSHVACELSGVSHVDFSLMLLRKNASLTKNPVVIFQWTISETSCSDGVCSCSAALNAVHLKCHRCVLSVLMNFQHPTDLHVYYITKFGCGLINTTFTPTVHPLYNRTVVQIATVNSHMMNLLGVTY